MKLCDKIKAIVSCSDGVWEFLNNETVMKYVVPYIKKNDANTACRYIIRKSRDFWKLEDEVIDDITCIVIICNYEQK